MHVLGRLLEPALVQELAQMSISARRVVEGASSGLHKAPVKGASVDFRERRAYVAGDSPRHIDWRVLARTDRVYVREYEEETNLRAMIYLDASGSMAYGEPSKFEYASRLAAAVSYLLLNQSESAGLAISNADSEAWLNAENHSDQLARAVGLLERASPGGKTVIDQHMLRTADRLGRRSLVIVLSDCLMPVDALMKGLARLAHARHEVVLVRVLHPDEITFPFDSWMRFYGAEQEPGKLLEAPAVRKNYLERFEQHAEELARGCSALGIERVTVQTSLPLIEAIRLIAAGAAMRFINLALLAGVAAAVLPVVIHLMYRARFKSVRWGAMMFLDAPTGVSSNRLRVSRWLLVAIRSLAIAVLAIAMARPLLTRSNESELQRRAVVIVIDASPSMGHPEQTESRLDLGRRAATTILNQLQRGDQAGLVVLGQPAGADVPPTADLQDIASRLASLKVGLSVATMADGESRAANLLVQAESGPKQIFLIADRDRRVWQSLSKPVDADVPISAITVGSTINDNVWIESFIADAPPAIANTPFEMRITIRNGSEVPRRALTLTLYGGPTQLDRVSVDIDAKSNKEIRRSLTFARPGSVMLTAAIDPSGTPADDFAMLAVEVIAPLNVLAISGAVPPANAAIPLAGDLDYLKLALTPFATSGEPGSDPFFFRSIPAANLASADLRNVDVLVLSDVYNFDDQVENKLEEFAGSGGGLVIAPGDHIDPDVWQKLYDRDGDGLAPAAIEMIKIASVKDRINQVDVNFDRMAVFSKPDSGDYFLRTDGGEPLLLSRDFGRGRVIVSAVPLNNRWSDFASTRVFLPVVQRAIKHAGIAGVPDRNQPIASTIEWRPGQTRERYAWVSRPDGRSERINLLNAGGAARAVYANTNLPGRYNIRISGSPGADFVIHGQPPDANVELLNDEQLNRICNAASVTRVQPDEIEIDANQPRRVFELSMPLVLGVVGLLGLELLVIRRLSGGGR